MSTCTQFQRRRLFATATALLAGTAVLGCHQRSDGDSVNDHRPSNSIERHQLNQSATTMVEMLEGQFPNVLVRQRGSNISVQIRGQGSFNSSNEALILIDGVENTARVLGSINPADVERVQVIKDGSAAMYGVRGANGVLLITMRRN